MDSTLDESGNTTTGELLKKLKALNIRFPKFILNFFLNILKENDVYDPNLNERDFVKKMRLANLHANDRLSIHKLQSFHHIFNRCPMFTAQTNNNSQNFKNALSTNFQLFNTASHGNTIGYGYDPSPMSKSPETMFERLTKE